MAMDKIAVAGLAAVLVAAMVVAVVVTKKSGESGRQINCFNKAANALCSNTDYIETCHKSLSNSISSNPRQLMQAAFDYTVENLGGVIKESSLYKKASDDKSVNDALKVCEEVLNTAVDDLKRSFDGMGKYEGEEVGEIVEDLRSWLSAVRTYQETCVDAFQNTSGETGEKMKELLVTAKELASNSLAMLDGISSIMQTLGIGNLKSAPPSRNLLSDDDKRRGLYQYNSPPAATAPINAVVAQDGSAQFKTINEALKTVPGKNNNTFVIFVRTGVYNEEVIIPKYTNKIVLLGEGPEKTRITGSKNYADGVRTYHTATVGVNGNDFVAKDIAFENSAGATDEE